MLLHTFKNLTFQVYLQNSIAVSFGKKNIIEARIGTGQFFASVPSIPNTYEPFPVYQPFIDKVLLEKNAKIIKWMLLISQC